MGGMSLDVAIVNARSSLLHHLDTDKLGAEGNELQPYAGHFEPSFCIREAGPEVKGILPVQFWNNHVEDDLVVLAAFML